MKPADDQTRLAERGWIRRTAEGMWGNPSLVLGPVTLSEALGWKSARRFWAGARDRLP